jgi:UDP:flavonoid glycosyltransferase YjiC (YdhE family)
VRILITTPAASGHFNVMAALGQELLSRRHDVLVASTPSLRRRAEELGFAFAPCGRDWNGENLQETYPELAEVPADLRHEWVVRELWGDRLPRSSYQDLLGVAEDWSPDLVLAARVELAGPTAAERLSIPHASVSAGGSTTPSAFLRLVAPRREVWRAELGLPPDPDGTRLFRFLYANFVPPSVFDDPTPPSTRRTFGPITPPAPAEADLDIETYLSAWPAPFHEAPLVYVTLGSLLGNVYPDLLARITEGVAEAPVRVVVTTGLRSAWATDRQWPPNVKVARYIPQEALLPHVGAVVCHAGLNTVVGALAAGVPIVAVPLQSDQFRNAGRCRDLGVGVTVRSDDPPSAFGDALRAVLGSASVRAEAARARALIGAHPHWTGAVDALENLASTARRADVAS